MITVLPLASAGTSDQPAPFTVIDPLYGTVVGVRVRRWEEKRERISTAPDAATPMRSRTTTVPMTSGQGKRRLGAGGEDSSTAVRIGPPPAGKRRIALSLTRDVRA